MRCGILSHLPDYCLNLNMRHVILKNMSRSTVTQQVGNRSNPNGLASLPEVQVSCDTSS